MPPISLSQCPESNGANDSSIQTTTIIISHVESHLLQAFRDTCWIPTRGIEWKLCIKKGFRWVMQTCLSMCYVVILSPSSQSSNMRIWPPCQIHLLRKTLVSKIDKKKWSLVHGPRVEGHSSTIMMYWIQQSQRFINLSNGHQSMERWIPPPTGF